MLLSNKIRHVLKNLHFEVKLDHFFLKYLIKLTWIRTIIERTQIVSIYLWTTIIAVHVFLKNNLHPKLEWCYDPNMNMRANFEREREREITCSTPANRNAAITSVMVWLVNRLSWRRHFNTVRSLSAMSNSPFLLFWSNSILASPINFSLILKFNKKKFNDSSCHIYCLISVCRKVLGSHHLCFCNL